MKNLVAQPAAPVAVPQSTPRPSIWATNGGIYFGRDVIAPANPKRPIEGKENEPSAPSHVDLKTTWTLAGGENVYSSDRHVLTIGPNGSGKTRKLLMPNLFRLRDWSCVVIDPKGELAAHTAVFRASRELRGVKHKVLVIDPFGVIPATYPALYAEHGDILQSHGFNPVAMLDPDSPRFADEAKALATALIKADDERGEKYWTQAAQALVKGLLMAFRVERGKAANLAMIRELFGWEPGDMAIAIEHFVKTYGKKQSGSAAKFYPAIAASLSEFISHNPQDREIGGIRRQAKVQTDWLDSSEMVDCISKGEFDFASIKQNPTTVYLVLPPDYLETHAIWLRLMVTAILRPLLRSVRGRKVPVLFMLDEFAQLGRMEVIENNYALMRGFGVKLWTIWQDLTQAKNLYKDRWESFISNAGIRHTYAPQDLTTLDYLSRMSGEDKIWHKTDSSSFNIGKGGINAGSSQGEVHIVERVFKPHELAALDQDEAVMFFRRGQYRLAVTPQPEFLTVPMKADAQDRDAKPIATLMQEIQPYIDD